MAEDIAVLGIKVLSDDIVKATRRLDKLENQSKKTTKASKGLKGSFGALKAAAVALAGSLAIKQFVATAGAFESMKVSLETVTGSAEKATMAMNGITQFAKDTPFQVSEITQAFIKLKALGIAPTEESLRSFGNTSSAMGKSLDQMIEAVADASTGEFERLKEFGIKARKEGENVKFTFQGVTTEVKNSSEDITAYLQAIGDEKFGGAMIKQMDTINGKISNLGDSWDALLVTFSEAGGGQLVKGALGIAIEAVNTITEGVEALPGIFVAGFAQIDKFFIGVGASAKRLALDVKAIWISGDEFRERLKQVNEIEEREKAAADAAAQAYIDAEFKKSQATGGITEAGASSTAKEDAIQKELDKQFEADILLFDMQARRIEMDEFERDEKQRILDEKFAAQEDYYNRLYNLEAGSLQAGADFAKAVRDNDLKSAVNNGALMLSNAAKTSKKAFELQKAFSLAKAIATLPSAVIDSYNNAGGFPWGIIPAGLMLKAGIDQINNIKNASFGSKSIGGGSVGGGGSTSPSAPVASGLPPGATATPEETEQRPTQEISISFEGDNIHSEAMRTFAENLAETIDDMGGVGRIQVAS